MADQKISELPMVSPKDGDIIPGYRQGDDNVGIILPSNTSLDVQPALDDSVAVLDETDNIIKKVALHNLGIYIRSDATGHLPAPTREMWQHSIPSIIAGRVGECTRELVSTHTSSADWVPIDPATDAEEAPAAWVEVTDYVVGDKVSFTDGGVLSYYICNRDHTSSSSAVSIDSAPNISFSNAWDDYTLVTVEVGFRGLFYRSSDVPNPVISDWIITTAGSIIYIEEYIATGWYINSAAAGVVNFIGLFDNEDSATRGIRNYITGEVYLAVFNNKLQVLVSYVAPSTVHEIFHWRFKETRPVVVFWGQGQTESTPRFLVDRVRTARVFYRYQFESNNPDEVLVGPDPGVRTLDSDEVQFADLITLNVPGAMIPGPEVAVADKTVFCFPPGSYRVFFWASHQIDATTSLQGWIYGVMDGQDDIQLQYSSGFASNRMNVDPLQSNLEDIQRTKQVIILEAYFKFTSATYLTFISGRFPDERGVDGTHYLVVERLSE